MTVTARGTVTDSRAEDGTTHLDLAVWTEDQDGNRLAPGRATDAIDA